MQYAVLQYAAEEVNGNTDDVDVVCKQFINVFDGIGKDVFKILYKIIIGHYNSIHYRQ